MSDSEEEIIEMDEEIDEDSDSNIDEEELRLLKHAEDLENQILSNKYLYNVYLELIEIYKQVSDLDSMRSAYQKFHEAFPLTEKIWLEWIHKEIDLGTNNLDRDHIIELFDKAVEDYLSIPLWLEYTNFIMDGDNFDATRTVLERAIRVGGLHARDGSLLWDFLREIELGLLSAKPEESPDREEQIKKIYEIFKRQLSVPLIGMEKTIEEWNAWIKMIPENLVDVKAVEWIYAKASKTLQIYEPFEEELLTLKVDEESLYNIYVAYIEKVTDPSTIICLYERALERLCLHPNVWLSYCNFVFKLGEVALKVSARSLRNCPWSEDLWVMKLRIFENLFKDNKEILTCFEEGLSSIAPEPGVELWLTYLEYIRRTKCDKDHFTKLFEQSSHLINPEVDNAFKVPRLFARIFAKLGDMEQVKSIWNQIMAIPPNKNNVQLWLEYISLEKHYGQENHLRSLYQKALNSCKKLPSYIAEEWLMWERETGTLEEMLNCMKKCKTVLLNVEPASTSEEIPSSDDRHQRGKKRRRHEDDNSRKDTKRGKEEGHSRKDNRGKDENHGKGNKRGNAEKRLTGEKRDMEVEESRKPKVPIEKDPKKTVFISNIHPKVDENKLRQLFPNAVNIDVAEDRQGKSKCFAYVQFAMEEEVMSALARDREPLDGRPVFISNCKPDKNERKVTFKYASTIEENKLFVRGLPIKKTKEEVEEIFKQYGAVDVRLVYHKSGQPKGLAYVEFPNSETAKKALEATDKMKIEEHEITVAISAPPSKKGGADDVPVPPTRNSRSRLQMPMFPRSLQVKKNDKPVGSKNSRGGETSQKSNDDFRKMLLGTK